MKRNRIYKVVCSLVLSVGLMASCVQPDFVVEISNNAISVQAGTYLIETYKDGESVKTKAPIPTGTFPDQPFVMSASYTPSGGSSSTFFEGISFSKNGDYWKASPTKYWPQSGQTMFLALSAKDLDLSVSWNADAATGFSVSNMPDNRSTQTDIMYAGTGNLSQNSGAAVMSFKHAQALLRFTGACDVAYNSSTNVGVTVTSITMSALRYRGSFSVSQVSNGTLMPSWSTSTTGAATAYSGTGNLPVAATDLGTGYMVYPQTPVAITVNYTLHNGKDASGNAVDLTRSYSFTPSGTWAAGNSYTYAISFTEGEISVSASLSAWEAASQTWFYATGNTVSHVGTNFPFNSVSNIWWRLDGSSSYEPLTYVEGTWGNSVKLEATSYYVTLTASGSNYTVSYQTKRSFVGIRVEPEVIYLPGCGSENFADSRYSKNYATSNNVKIYVYAMYDDGTEEDVSSSATWAGNMPRRFYVDDDNYTHAANAYASSTCGGAVSVYRAYCSSTSANIYLGPAVDAYRYYFYNLPSLGNAPQNFITASYTEGKVTKTANVKATIINPALPVTLSISPASREAFSGGYTVNYAATVTLDDGSTKDVTSQAEWSADGLVTSNGGGGFTTGNVNGSTTIRASYTYNDVTVTASSSLTLRDRIVNSIELSVYDDYVETWSSSSAKVEAGHNQSYRLRVVWEDGESWITSGFNLTSTNSSVISASGSGSTAVNTGSTNVTATFGGRTSNTLSMTVIPAGEIRIVINISNAVNKPEGWWRDEDCIYYNVRISYYSWIPSWELYGEIHVYRVRYVNGIIDTSWGSGGYKEITTSCYIDTEWNEYWYGPILSTYEYEGALYYSTVDESIDMRDYVDDRFYLGVVTPYGTYWCYLDFYLP